MSVGQHLVDPGRDDLAGRAESDDVVAGAVVVWLERERRPPIVARYFGYIVAEGLAYAVVLAAVIGTTVGALFGAWALPALQDPGVSGFGLPLQLVLSIGAGLYEEVLFRLLLLPAVIWLLERWGQTRFTASLWGVVLTSLLFSGAHYVGPLGDTFALYSFTFRTLAGIFFSLVFLVRGFGITAGAHAAYDLLVGLA